MEKLLKVHCRHICLNRWISAIKNCRLQYPFYESFRIRCDIPCYMSQKIMHKIGVLSRSLERNKTKLREFRKGKPLFLSYSTFKSFLVINAMRLKYVKSLTLSFILFIAIISRANWASSFRIITCMFNPVFSDFSNVTHNLKQK